MPDTPGLAGLVTCVHYLFCLEQVHCASTAHSATPTWELCCLPMSSVHMCSITRAWLSLEVHALPELHHSCAVSSCYDLPCRLSPVRRPRSPPRGYGRRPPSPPRRGGRSPSPLRRRRRTRSPVPRRGRSPSPTRKVSLIFSLCLAQALACQPLVV